MTFETVSHELAMTPPRLMPRPVRRTKNKSTRRRLGVVADLRRYMPRLITSVVHAHIRLHRVLTMRLLAFPELGPGLAISCDAICADTGDDVGRAVRCQYGGDFLARACRCDASRRACQHLLLSLVV